jgi:hypothetical protein
MAAEALPPFYRQVKAPRTVRLAASSAKHQADFRVLRSRCESSVPPRLDLTNR